MTQFCDEKTHLSANITEIICTFHAISLHPWWGSAKKQMYEILKAFIDLRSGKGFFLMSNRGVYDEAPWRKLKCNNLLFHYMGAYCIIHFACYTTSPFWWEASRLTQCLGADYVIHFKLRVARSSLTDAKNQKQWKLYKLGPIPDLLKQSQLTILSVIFVLSPRKLVKVCYFKPRSILTVDQWHLRNWQLR